MGLAVKQQSRISFVGSACAVGPVFYIDPNIRQATLPPNACVQNVVRTRSSRSEYVQSSSRAGTTNAMVDSRGVFRLLAHDEHTYVSCACIRPCSMCMHRCMNTYAYMHVYVYTL